MNKLVSIVLPTFNGEAFLKKSIDSCLNQTYSNIELIIVNDCSTDSSEEIILSYVDPRIRYIKNASNQRLPKSLNIGFSHALGECFTWTSDDNFFEKTAIEKMMDALKLHKVGLVCAPYYTIDDKDVITGDRSVASQENILLDNIVKACFLYKSEVHYKLKGYNPDLFLVEDYDFWIRATFEGFSFYQLTEKLYYYRFHDNSLTEKRRVEISKALFSLLVHHEIKFKVSGYYKFLKSEFYLKLSKLAMANKTDALEYYKKAIFNKPILFFDKVTLKILLKSL